MPIRGRKAPGVCIETDGGAPRVAWNLKMGSHGATRDAAPEGEVPAAIALRPVVPALLGLMAGIWIGERLPHGVVWAWGALGAALVLAAIGALRRHRVPLAAPLFFTALGYLLIHPWVAPDLPPHHVSRFSGPVKWRITGIVDAAPVITEHRMKFLLRAESLCDGAGSTAVSGKIQVTVAGTAVALAAGDRVMLQSRLRPFRNFNNPGGFDYRRYMAFAGVRVRAFCSGGEVTVLERLPLAGFNDRLSRYREAVAALIEGRGRPKDQAVLKALVIGRRDAIPPELREAFNRAGVGHLLAISGLHIGIVAMGFFRSFSWLLARFEVLLWHAWTRKGAALLSLAAVMGYGLLAGMSPSTQRAVAMAAVFLGAFVVEREPELYNTLALAALVILIAHPPALFAVSFQLSFAAVFWILFGLRGAAAASGAPAERFAGSLWAVGLRRLGIFIWVSLLAFLGSLPLVMVYFNQISLVGLAANCLFVPLIGFVVVPLGVVGAGLLAFSPLLAELAFGIALFILGWGLTGVEWVAGWPWAAVKTVTPSSLEVVCFYAFLWGGLCWLRAARTIAPEGASTATEGCRPRKALAALVLALALLTAAGDIGYWCYQRFWRSDLRVTVLDVQQGSCVLVEFPGGHCMLIDGGGFSDNTRFDIGQRVVAPFLWRRKIRTLDTLALSHPDSDHLNGLLYIAQHFNIKRVWSNHEAGENTGYQVFREILDRRAIPHPDFRTLPRSARIGGVAVEVLYPPADFSAKRARDGWRNTNNNSLVLRLRLGDHTFLFPGDIMAPAEAELVRTIRPALGDAVLVAPHHGSRTSSTPAFLNWSRPKTVVISSRGGVRGQQPHPKVLARYRALNAAVYTTFNHGAVAFATDGRRLRIDPYLKDESGPNTGQNPF
jgi:competence protein ComEC